MKTKILDFLNDYYIDLVKYYKKCKKKIRKVYRYLKHRIKNPKTNIGKFICPYLIDIKEFLFKEENKKKTYVGISLFVIIIFISIVILPSYAIYQNERSFSLFGKIISNKTAWDYDYSLQIYLEESDKLGYGTDRYKLVNKIPEIGYVYNKYECINGSTLTYDETTKEAIVNLEKKDICSIYFDLDGISDINVNIMLENKINSNDYSKSNIIPAFGYKYSHYECKNNSILVYDKNNHKVKISSKQKDACCIYFKKEESDIEISLYVEKEINTDKFEEKLNIPENKNYILDINKTKCVNESNEPIESNVSYIDGYIEVLTDEVSYCEVYLKLEEG